MRRIIQFFFLLRQMQLWWLGRLGILCQRKSAEDQKGDYSSDGDDGDDEDNGDDDDDDGDYGGDDDDGDDDEDKEQEGKFAKPVTWNMTVCHFLSEFCPM